MAERNPIDNSKADGEVDDCPRNSGNSISIEVACATPDKQLIIKLELPRGTTARESVEKSAMQDEFPRLDIPNCAIGVFGEAVTDCHLLSECDRVEIYRPLINDPRDARRSLAARGSVMGGKGRVDGAKKG